MATSSKDPAADLYYVRIGGKEYVAKYCSPSEKRGWFCYLVYDFEGTTAFVSQNHSGMIRPLTEDEALLYAIQHPER